MNVLLAVVGVVIGGLVLWDAFKPEGGLKAIAESANKGSGSFD